MRNNSRAVFTISSKNYIHYAVTMLKSVEVNNKEVDLYLILVDTKEDVSLYDQNINIIWVEELGIKDFEKISFKYNILELNTNVKPTAFKKLLEKYHKVIYLDPDIYVYYSLLEVFTILDDNSISLTPHMLQPQYTHHHDRQDIVSEIENLKTGAYNLGFIGLSQGLETDKFLDWWCNCCLCCAFDEHESGVFVDQKWLSLVTCYFEKVKVIRNYGMNVAYWNIHERNLKYSETKHVLVNDQKLIFFHFSGHNYIDGECSRLSKHLLAYRVEDGSILQSLLLNYNREVSRNKVLLQRFTDINYGYSTYSNGEVIEDLARRVYSRYINEFKNIPFDASGDFYKFASNNSLTSKCYSKSNSADVIKLKNSKKVYALEKILSIIHRIIGVKRFTLILRFMRHYSITTNYAKVFAKSVKKS
jgi:hypothetical protein